MFKAVLIANRGEIAVRVIRACREMGIATAAVYSEADWHSPHIALADSAHCIGPAPAAESYLRIESIVDAARRSGADAVHPGYGFLSENPDFAQACEEAGICFIGPSAAVIRALGDKIAAKRIMESAGVPVVPGYFRDDQSDARLQQEAEVIGYPILIKAAAGGGGRGMRVVESAELFRSTLSEARREAKAGFGDDRVLLERYIRRPRHVEFQIFGDTHGNVVHLFERECSIQRRHQKIIEESPSPVMTTGLRERMANAAVAVGKAAGYVNAGTVEFLVEERPDGDHRFYFLEVNTRLQVEHPVTEMTTGIDLVKLQLRIANGEALPSDFVTQAGHAMEVRIYAEDPESGFLPSVGRLETWIPPVGPWVRVDSGVEHGGEVSPYYDPLLAKLIVRGEDRDETLARMERALMDFHVLGVKTNIGYLLDILRHPAFRAGGTHTDFLSEHLAGWKPPPAIPTEVLLAVASESVLRQGARVSLESVESDHNSPWRLAGAWRN